MNNETQQLSGKQLTYELICVLLVRQDAHVTGITRDVLCDSRSFWKLRSHDVTMTHIYV